MATNSIKLIFSPGTDGSYHVHLEYTAPKSEPPITDQAVLTIERSALFAVDGDPQQYGRALAQMMYSGKLRSILERCLHSAQGRGYVRFRVELSSEDATALLNQIHWEQCLAPDLRRELPISVWENVGFSRFLSKLTHSDGGVHHVRSRHALVVISDLTGREWSGAYTFDPEKEVALVRAALPSVEVDVIGRVKGALDQRVTLGSIRSALARGYHVLYLVAHGLLDSNGVPKLVLGSGETSSSTDVTPLINMIADLRPCPRLVVFASCDSATPTQDALHRALAPRLVQAGVPAVLGFQGRVHAHDAQALIRTMFEELEQDDRIIRALGIARRKGYDEGNQAWWQAVLWEHLDDERLWSVAGDIPEEISFDRRVPFCGRVQVRETLLTQLKDKRLHICIAGLGGVGKTALAEAVAQDYCRATGRRAVRVRLQSHLAGPELKQTVQREVLYQLNASGDIASKDSVLDITYRRAVQANAPLILLDGLSSLSGIKTLLQDAGVRFLITSRTYLIDVTVKNYILEAMAPDEAVSLARAYCESLDEAQALRLVSAVEGLPLAIEIAAALINSEEGASAEEYLRELEQEHRRLKQLENPADEVQSAEYSVMASIELSYQALPEPLRRLFLALGVFSESFDLQAASAVVGIDAKDGCKLLWLRSLIQRIGGVWYRLHALVRLYARSKLEAAEMTAARLRHARYYCAVAKLIDQELYEGKVFKALQRFDRERTEIESAWRWAADQQGDEEADLTVDFAFNLQLVASYRYQSKYAGRGDGGEWLIALYRKVVRAADQVDSWASGARDALAHLLYLHNQVDEVEQLYEEALLKAGDEPARRWAVLINRSGFDVEMERYERASLEAREALALLEGAERSPDDVGNAKLNLAQALIQLGDWAQASRLLEEVLGGAADQRGGLAVRARTNRAELALMQGLPGHARADLLVALRVPARLLDPVNAAERYLVLAQLHTAASEPAKARRALSRAERLLDGVRAPGPLRRLARVRGQVAG